MQEPWSFAPGKHCSIERIDPRFHEIAECSQLNIGWQRSHPLLQHIETQPMWVSDQHSMTLAPGDSQRTVEFMVHRFAIECVIQKHVPPDCRYLPIACSR